MIISDPFLWYSARIAALSAFVVLSFSLLTGMAIRAGYLGSLAKNKAVIALHGFLAWFWVPLVLLHIVCLLLHSAAQIYLIDVFIPFRVSYSSNSALAIGLGTIGFLALLFVWGTSLFRQRMSVRAWLWIHRISYPMFGVFVLHAQLAGTDFSNTIVSVAGWSILGMLIFLALPRLLGGRVERMSDEGS